MNRIIIKGRLTRDPELNTGANGKEFCKFTVAVDKRKGKNGEREADFFDCTAFDQKAVAIDKFLSKGREVLVEGRMESSKKEVDGVKKTYWGLTVENFEFCGKKDDAAPVQTVDAQSGYEVVNTEETPF